MLKLRKISADISSKNLSLQERLRLEYFLKMLHSHAFKERSWHAPGPTFKTLVMVKCESYVPKKDLLNKIQF